MSLKDIHNKKQIPKIQPQHTRFHSTSQLADIKPHTPTPLLSYQLNDSHHNDSDAQSSIGVTRKRSFEYITDTDESTCDGHDQLQFDEYQMPIIANKIDHIETIQIQSKLKKFIGNETQLILSQFIEIMKKIAPHITSKDATEMFNKVDRFHNGQIDTNVLLNNNFLARLILKLYRDDNYESSVDNGDLLQSDIGNDFDIKYKHMNPKQLREETIRLQSWIIDYGQPAVEKVIELEAMINIYENERNSQQIQISRQSIIMSELNTLQNELKQSAVRSSFLMVDNRKLLLTAEQSIDEWQQQTNLINIKQKELQRYKKLSKEMSIINDKYLSKNKQLNNKNKEFEQELQTLRQIILSLENDIMQLNQEYALEREEFTNEINKLKTDLQLETQTITSPKTGGGISELLEANRTITIDKNIYSNTENNKDELYKTITNYKQDSLKRQRTLKNFYNNSIHNNLYGIGHSRSSLFGASPPPPNTYRNTNEYQWETIRGNTQTTNENESLSDEEFQQEEQNANAQIIMIDDELKENSNSNLDELMRMGTSWKNLKYVDSNKSIRHMRKYSDDIEPNMNTNSGINNEQSQIFEDAINAEIKLELENQIKKELIEDFELKLYQKDIENKLKLNKVNEKMESEKNELINKYEILIDKYKSDLDKYKINEEKQQENIVSNNNNNDKKNKNVLEDNNILKDRNSNKLIDTFDDEKEEIIERPQWHSKGRKSVDMRFINQKSNNNNNKMNVIEIHQIFKTKLNKIFAQSTLLWSFPLIK